MYTNFIAKYFTVFTETLENACSVSVTYYEKLYNKIPCENVNCLNKKIESDV